MEGPRNARLFETYPLVLTTGSRLLPFYHSQHRDIPTLRQKHPEPLVEIHPDTAGKCNVEDGDMVVVETQRGRIEIRARVTEDIIPGVVNIPHAWSEANVNILTDDTPQEPVLGYPSLKSMLCKITKKPGEN
jgi:anaerobic selenocysteine-containing dehydrogenase